MKDALKSRKGFTFYRSYWDVINELSDEQAGELMKGLATYQFTGEPPKFKGVLNAVWKGFETLVEGQVNGYLSAKKTEDPKRGADRAPKGGPLGGPSGGPSRAPASKEQRVKNKEKRENNNNNHHHVKDYDDKPFKETVTSINEEKKILTPVGVQEFVDYWNEVDIKTKEVRWKSQDFFDPVKRMVKWANNNYSGRAKPRKRGERGAEFKNQVF